MKNFRLCIIILELLFIFQIITSQEYYYGMNGFGRLTLNKNKTFYFEYVENRVDSGIYIRKLDTIILISHGKYSAQIPFDSFNLMKKNTIKGFYILYEYDDETYEKTKQKLNLMKTDIYADSVLTLLCLTKSMRIKKNSFINVYSSIGTLYSVIKNDFDWDSDSILINFTYNNLFFSDQTYFEHVRFIEKENLLLPATIRDYITYLNMNKDIIYPLKKGSKNQKFKKHSLNDRYFTDFIINSEWFYDDIPKDFGVYKIK